jgi:hypothetical protein
VSGALGVKSYQGFKFQTVATNITGLLPPGSNGVNHGMAQPHLCDAICSSAFDRHSDRWRYSSPYHHDCVMNSRTIPVDGFAHDLCYLTLSAVIVDDLSAQEFTSIPLLFPVVFEYSLTFTSFTFICNIEFIVIDIQEFQGLQSV